MPDREYSGGTFTNPVAGVALGDPFVLRWRGRFYLYGTNDGPPLPDGRQIPVYRSDDLIHWDLLGGALEPAEPGLDHWAPEVLAWNGRFFMVVSFGDIDRRGHALWVAVADRPEGPFRLAGQISGPGEAFSIDGSWLLDDDGQLYLFRCLDFVDENAPPYGTGIVVQRMLDPLTPAGPPTTVLRAHSPWHRFEAPRTMPLYGGRTFPEWTTIEGPAPVRRAGRVFCGYSGGNFMQAYGTGEAAADHPLGPYEDLRGREGPLFGTTPGLVEGPGHFSVVRPDLTSDWIVLHGRTSGEPVRRVWLCPAAWDRDGVRIGPLTDQPQPAPPLPRLVDRFDRPERWRIESGRWSRDEGEWRHVGLDDEPGSARLLQPPALPNGWVIEIHLRFPEAGAGEAGIEIDTGCRIGLHATRPTGFVSQAGAAQVDFPLPTLGKDPFAPARFHAFEVRCDGVYLIVRVDGVTVARIRPIADPKSSQLLLFARGVAAFDALSIASGWPF